MSDIQQQQGDRIRASIDEVMQDFHEYLHLKFSENPSVEKAEWSSKWSHERMLEHAAFATFALLHDYIAEVYGEDTLTSMINQAAKAR